MAACRQTTSWVGGQMELYGADKAEAYMMRNCITRVRMEGQMTRP